MNNTKTMIVKNRSAGVTVYTVTLDSGAKVRRFLQSGETAKIPVEELIKLSYAPGGKALMEQFLQIQDEEVRAELNLNIEPEYNMSEDDVVELLKTGTLEEFLDVLDFAPEGVLDLIKQYAVSLPLNDVPKRQALADKTGMNVDKALVLKATAETHQQQNKTEETATPGRRTESKYKVVTPINK